MRIAVMLLSLVLVAIIGFQAFTLYRLGATVKPEEKGAVAAGLGIAFFCVLGGAFSFGVPALSTTVLFIAGLCAKWITDKGLYADTHIWGRMAWALTALELMSIIKTRREELSRARQ